MTIATHYRQDSASVQMCAGALRGVDGVDGALAKAGARQTTLDHSATGPKTKRSNDILAVRKQPSLEGSLCLEKRLAGGTDYCLGSCIARSNVNEHINW